MQSAVDKGRDGCAQAIQDEPTPAWIEGALDGLQAGPESSPNMGRGSDYALGWLTARYRSDLAERLLQGLPRHLLHLLPTALLTGL